MSILEELGLPTPTTPARGAALIRALQRFAASAPGTALLSRLLPPLDSITLRLSKGRATCTESLAGLPTIEVTTRGARSGLPRTVKLVAVVCDGELAVIGSNWGASTHPAWVHNVGADPHVTLAYHGRRVEALAEEADGELAERIWASARSLYHGFSTYPTRTQGRTIRVFILNPSHQR